MSTWHEDGIRYGWTMPATPKWKRLPIIRHVRTLWLIFQVELWYSRGPGMIGIRTGYDDWVLHGMWKGYE